MLNFLKNAFLSGFQYFSHFYNFSARNHLKKKNLSIQLIKITNTDSRQARALGIMVRRVTYEGFKKLWKDRPMGASLRWCWPSLRGGDKEWWQTTLGQETKRRIYVNLL